VATANARSIDRSIARANRLKPSRVNVDSTTLIFIHLFLLSSSSSFPRDGVDGGDGKEIHRIATMGERECEFADDVDEDDDEAFLDELAEGYEEVADLDHGEGDFDHSSTSSEDGELEDRDEADARARAPPRDDTELIIGTHDNEACYACAWSSDRTEACVVSGGGDTKAFFARGRATRALEGHGESVSAVGFSACAKVFATAGLDGRVNVYDSANGELKCALEGPGGGIEWVAWHPRGRVVLAGSEDFTAWMWNADDGALMQVFSGHSESVSCGGFTPDGKFVVTGSVDGSLRVWHPRTAECVHAFRGHPFHDGPLTCLDFHPTTPGLIMTGSEDNTARLVSSATGKVLAPLVAHTETIETVGFCDVMPCAATGSIDKQIIVWDTNVCQSRGTLAHDGAVSKLKWIPGSMCMYRYVFVDGMAFVRHARQRNIRASRVCT